jgi:hypothetical protein
MAEVELASILEAKEAVLPNPPGGWESGTPLITAFSRPWSCACQPSGPVIVT